MNDATIGGTRRPASQFLSLSIIQDAAHEGGRYLELVTEETTKLFGAIAERYAAAGRPDRLTYHFDSGAMGEAHRELEAAGMIQRVFGVPGGVCWRLTEAGVAATK